MFRKLLSKLVKKKPSRKTAPRPKFKSRPKPKTKPKTSRKKPVKTKKQPPLGDQIAEVVAFFRIPVVAVLKVTKGTLKAGETVWIKGHTTDLKQTISSMQVNHQPIRQARKGDEVGVKISSRARRGDRVYRL